MAAAIGWAALLPAAAFARSRPALTPLAHAAVLVYGFGSVICHQIPARSFHLWAAPLPVCARCTGIYLGAALAAIYAAAIGANWRAARGGAPTRVLLAFAAFPTLVTLAYEWTTGVTPSNLLRAVAALSLGAAASAIVLASAADRVN